MFLHANKILAIGAHPDDVEYSCLGFLLKQKKVGTSISVFNASHGSRGDMLKGNQRVQESAKSWVFNNIELHQNNSSDFDYINLEKQIRDLISENGFDCILVHDPHDSHQEHRITYDITKSALRRLGVSLIRYKSVSSTNFFTSNMLVDISEYFEVKQTTLKLHESQAHKPYMSSKSVELFHSIYQPGSDTSVFYESFFIESLQY